MDRGACQAAVQGVAKSRTWLSTLAESYEGINITARKCAFSGVRCLAWLLQGGTIKVYHSPKLLCFRRSRWDDKMETKEKWVITFRWKSYQTHTYEDVSLKVLSSFFLVFKEMLDAKSLQLYPTLCDPTDYSPAGSSVHGILQVRALEWVAMPSSRGSSRPRDQACLS